MLHAIHRLAVIKYTGTLRRLYPEQGGAKPLDKWQKEEGQPRKPDERPKHTEETRRQGTAVPAETGNTDQTTDGQDPDPGGSLV